MRPRVPASLGFLLEGMARVLKKKKKVYRAVNVSPAC